MRHLSMHTGIPSMVSIERDTTSVPSSKDQWLKALMAADSAVRDSEEASGVCTRVSAGIVGERS
jgi:hypothetical protein